MDFSESDRTYLETHHAAAMITVGSDGLPKVSRVAVGLVDGRLWSSGTKGRLRTRRLRQDPRCTLFVFDPAFSWLALETTVTILEGDDAPQLNLRLYKTLQNAPDDEEEYLRAMEAEERIIFEFDVHRSYGIS